MTIQGMDTSEENYFLYNIEGEELFTINNDDNNTFVKIHDEKRVTLRGFFISDGDEYRVLPYSFIDINSSKGSLTYQFLADNHKKSFSYPVRFRKFEVIGGVKFGYVKSLARLHSQDKPLLVLLPNEGKSVFGKTNSGIRVIALQEGLVYLDNRGISKELPLFEGDIHEFERELKAGELNPLQIEDDGVISSNSQKLVLNLSITDGVISKKVKGGYREVKTKYLNITEYSHFQNISKLSLSSASEAFYVQRENNVTYLNAPYEIPIDKKIVVKGKDTLFGFSKYFGDADFSTKVPRLDKPKLIGHKSKNSRYYDYLDIDNMYGLFVSDEKAEVFYSKDKKRWIKAVENYRYAPPRYLYDPKVKGQFIAPKPFRKTKDTMYYKIVSALPSYEIAFHGRVKIGSNSVVETTHKDLITIKQKEVVIEANKGKLEACGVLFNLDSYKKLTYSFADKVEREFTIVQKGSGYEYSIKEKLNPFKTYKIAVKGYKEIEYTPQLSCKYHSKSKPKDILSLYNRDNFLHLVPNAPSREARKVTLKQGENNSTQKGVTQIPKELIPIYGDGIRFGLLAYGVTMDELTIDKDFSLKVASIFTKKIQPLLNNKKLQARLKKEGEIIEGATVIIKINKDGNREILSLFSYPYPNNNDIKKELIIDTLNNRKSTIQNRALDMLVHPGSTFKIATSIALSQEGRLDNFEQLKGKTDIYNAPFGEDVVKFHLKNYSDPRGVTESTTQTDFMNAFSHSYNTYFGYAGLTLHRRLSQKYTDNLFPIILNQAQRKKEFALSKVADELYFNRKIPLSKKYKIYGRASQFPTIFTTPKEVADSAIGQYEVYTTPLQMALVTSVIYDNKLQLPTIIKDSEVETDSEDMTTDRDRNLFQEFVSIFRSEESFKTIQEAMRKVIVEGTAKKTFRTFKSDKCKVYGKTGTAQKGKNGLYDGWFVSFTKGLKEDIVIATVVRNSGTGGSYSAPINRKIIEAWIKKESKSD